VTAKPLLCPGCPVCAVPLARNLDPLLVYRDRLTKHWADLTADPEFTAALAVMAGERT